MYNCKHCDKKYKYSSGLSRHIKLKHNTTFMQHNTTSDTTFIQHNTTSDTTFMQHNTTPKNCICRYCNKVFSFSQSKYRHEKKCKLKNQDIVTKKEHQEELKKLEHEITEKLTKQFSQMLIESKSNNTKHSNNVKHSHNNTNSNNSIIGTQNITIVQLGKEDVLGTISQDDKLKILNDRYKSVLSLVKLMHCSGKYPQFNNSIISNLKSEYALTYKEDDNKFVTTSANNLVSDIVSYRSNDVEEILDENKEKVSEQTTKKVTELLSILEKEDEDLTKEDRQFLKDYNKNIMTLIYDNRKELKQNINKF
jgi:hypothetical protein